ncbi:MAG: hypothetical protein AB7L66_05145 [Gemmatimonadales bacterium]
MPSFGPPLLLAIHIGLLVWAIGGLIEWFVSSPPWPRVSNNAFPSWLLLVHWLAVLNGAATFVVGFLRRWPGTPTAMAIAYSGMAAVCIIETFWFLTGRWKFVAMLLEFAAYIGISIVLRRHPAFTARLRSRERTL